MTYGVMSPVAKCSSNNTPVIRPVLLSDLIAHLLVRRTAGDDSPAVNELYGRENDRVPRKKNLWSFLVSVISWLGSRLYSCKADRERTRIPHALPHGHAT